MRFEYADGRMPVAMTAGGVTYYLAYDQVGSLKAVADASGNVVKKIGYDSFGNIIEDTNPAFAVPFGFAGGLHDRDTGLVRFGYRDYDPDVGRWTAKDPILFDGGDTDLYGYCVGDPINLIDTFGLSQYDQRRIYDTFQNTVKNMTESGERHPNTFWNGISGTLNLTLGIAKPYLSCGDQTDKVIDALGKNKYDDKWTVDVISTPLHTWGMAKSDNPADPTIFFDPWFGVIYRDAEETVAIGDYDFFMNEESYFKSLSPCE